MIPDDRSPVNFYERKTTIGTAVSIYTRFPAYISIQWPRKFDQNGIPIKDFSLNIGPLNKSIFVRALEKFIQIYDRDDVYYLKDGKLNMYGNNQVVHTCKMSDNYVKMVPTIVTDMNENAYEGATLFLNKEIISGDLTYSELLALYDILKEADIFSYTYLLLSSLRSGDKSIEVHNIPSKLKEKLDIWAMEGVDKKE